MNEFYQLIDQLLDHDRRCPTCNDKMWIFYSDGHVADICLTCPEDKFSLDLAGYITTYPEPDEPPPENFEIRDHGTHPRLKHEKAYRKKCPPGSQ